MNAVYKHIRAAYKANQMSNIRFDVGSDGMCAVYGANKFLKVYASKLLAERDVAAQQAKCAKFIA